MDWIDVDHKLPKRRGDSSALVLIARPLRSRPARLVVTVGYLQKFDGDYIWVDALSRVLDLPSVRYWMPLPDPPDVQRKPVEVAFDVGQEVKE